MRKALSSACLLLLICFGGSAWAGKPKLAILGLEVAPGPTGVVDPAMTQVARDITKELRQRAQSGASPYVVAPNSGKELTDEKLLMSCDNEAKDCMAVIASGLAADALLYGRVEKKGDVYRVSLKLLDVKAKTIDVGGDEMAVGGSVTGVSKRLYSKLIGDSPSGAGALVVTARSQSGAAVDGGKVMVDEDRKGVLAGGKLTLTGLTEGRHIIAIEVGGLQRFEATVTVRGGEPSTLDALLLDKDAPSPSPSRAHALLWKASFGAGLGVLAAGTTLATYSYFKMNDQGAVLHVKTSQTAPPGTTIGVGDCGKTDSEIKMSGNVISFDHPALVRACFWNKLHYAGIGALSVGGAAALVSLIMLTRDSGATEKPPTGARTKRPDVAITPIVLPDVAGASLSVTW
jgi:hypothetical protein